ncbi:uncharacterized protein TNCV_2416131 [Trichonephila clavipes]|nr:uncharacterized protein TNCV_2416131 [Trichonephila clavipes]
MLLTGLRRSPRGLHTRPQLSSLLKLNLDLSLKTNWFHFIAVQSCYVSHLSKRRHRWMDDIGSIRNGHRDTRSPSARNLAMVWEDIGAHSKGAPCVQKDVNDAVGATCACRMM